MTSWWKKYIINVCVGILFLFIAAGFLFEYGQHVNDEPFEWLKLEEAQKAAEADGKTIMVFVEAEWCGICRQMKSEIFPERVIRKQITANFHPVAVDLDSRKNVLFNGQEMTEREFARKMNVSVTPTILFIDPEGEVMAYQTGFNPVDRFEALLVFINSDEFGELSFEDFFKRYNRG